MKYVVSAMLVMVAIIHLLPLAGVLGSERLAELYGVKIDDPSLLLLMRHRAVLFGILGIFLLVAAFRPALQPAALLAGLVSVASFLVLAGLSGADNTHIDRIFTVDIVALVGVMIGAAAWLRLLRDRQRRTGARSVHGGHP